MEMDSFSRLSWMSKEEIFIFGYIIRRTDDEKFWISNALTNEGISISEKKLGEWMDRIWSTERKLG